jgi:hypothetical protein
MGIRSLRTASISTGVKRSKVWDQSAVVTNIGQLAYESIATVTVGAGGLSTVSFTSIPNTYKHLQLRCLARTTAAVDNDAAFLNFNSDSSANYAAHNLRGNGGITAASGGVGSSTVIQRFAGGNQSSINLGAAIVDILDYASTNKNKTLRDLGGYDFNGTGNIYFSGGLWINTNAITSITITTSQGGNWSQYSQFALYGIKG